MLFIVVITVFISFVYGNQMEAHVNTDTNVCSEASASVIDIPRCANQCNSTYSLLCGKTSDHLVICTGANIIKQEKGSHGFECPVHCRFCYLNSSMCPRDNSNHRQGCNCSNSETKQSWLIAYKGAKYSVIDFVYIPVCLLNATFVEYSGNPNPFGHTTKKRDNQVISQINWNIPQLIIITPLATQGSIFVSWTYNTYSDWFNCNPGQCLNVIDYSIFQLTGSLVVKVFINDTIDNNAAFSIAPTDTCSTDQPFGGDMFSKWQCHSLWIKVGFILICILIIVALVLIIYGIIKMVCCCYNRGAPGIIINNNQPEQTSGDDMMIALKRLTSNQMMVIVLIGLICGAAGQPSCVNGVALTSTSQVCQDSGTTETCFFQGNILLSLPYIGSTSCIFFNSPDTGQNLGQLEITYTNSLKFVSLQQNYYTSPWNGVWASQRTCSHDSACQCFSGGPNGCCSTYLGTPIDINMVGTTAVNYPGRSICTSQCGCAGCGCFFCDSSCVYSRAAFQPSGSVAQVMSVFNTVIRPTVNVAFTNGVQSWNQNIDITAGEVAINSNISLAIVGTLEGSSVEFGTNKLIIYNGNAYIGPAAVSNGPVRGIPGDIQSPTIQGLTSPSVDHQTNQGSFLFAPDLYTAQFTTDSTSYSFAQSGTSILNSGQYTKLPAVIGSTLYTYSNGQLVGSDAQPGALLVSVFMNQPFVISRQVNIVCPNILKVACAGCFNCLTGAQFLVDAYSQCNSGFATVSVISEQNVTLSVYAVSLGKTTNTSIINFQGGNKYLVGTIKLVAGSKVSSLPFQCTLENPAGITITNETFPPGWVSIGNDAISWFNGLTSPWDTIKWVVIAIVAVSTVVVLAVVGYYGYKWWKKRNNSNDYEYDHIENSD